jgi:hypothetical protein
MRAGKTSSVSTVRFKGRNVKWGGERETLTQLPAGRQRYGLELGWGTRHSAGPLRRDQSWISMPSLAARTLG